METLADRRRRPRFGIKSKVKCRIAGADAFEEADLDNLSEVGTFLWLRQKIAIGTRLFLLIESDDPMELPIRCTATVVRQSGETEDARFGYGCQIEDKTDPNAE